MWVSRPGVNDQPTLISTTVKCNAIINNVSTVAILDTASEISLVSQSFAIQLKLKSEPWNCPPLTVASGELFNISLSCMIEVRIFSFITRGRVGIEGLRLRTARRRRLRLRATQKEREASD